ncbi:MAG: hypothetical protein SFY80_14500 [Verrucomicrobiota bacterium]|nr:hypothetical protein [Verrucomicrobiota bacterium]
MFSEFAFEAFIEDLARLNNLSHEVAGDCAVLIGDTPCIDDDGRAIVIIDGRELHLILPE